jgi:hypothetical protein
MVQDTGNPVTPEGREFVQSLKLAVVAVVSAALTAILVIGGGEALLRRSSASATPASTPLLVQTTG